MKTLIMHPFASEALALTASIGLVATEPSELDQSRSVYLHSTLHVEGKPTNDFKLVVISPHEEEKTIYGSGSFSLLLPEDRLFSLVIGKENYRSETVLLDTHIPTGTSCTTPYYANVELMPSSYTPVRSSPHQLPYGKISFSKTDGNFRLLRMNNPPPARPLSISHARSRMLANAYTDTTPGMLRQAA